MLKSSNLVGVGKVLMPQTRPKPVPWELVFNHSKDDQIGYLQISCL